MVLIIPLCDCGCKKDDLGGRQLEMAEKLEQLDRAYCAADVTSARQILQQEIETLENCTSWSRDAVASRLFLNYARLYVLAKRIGDQDSAETALIKARYWFLRAEELSGSSTSNAMVNLRWRTDEHIFESAVKWDNAVTSGKGPKYLQDLHLP
jgi:hypothetical protein